MFHLKFQMVLFGCFVGIIYRLIKMFYSEFVRSFSQTHIKRKWLEMNWLVILIKIRGLMNGVVKVF